jgi:2-deoxy-D-gluconate 3-dehydrogenase
MPAITDLSGRAAIVTGAGRGLGRAMALALAAAGMGVVLVARREADLAAAAREIEAAGGRAAVLPADVGDPAAAARAVEEAVRTFGRLDVLVNNAGIGTDAPSLDYPLEQWEALMRVNLTAPFLFSQAAARQMIAQGGGKIINIASMFGLAGEPRLAAYCASKGGLIQLTRVLAVEWARHNIQVNAIAPGYFDTDMAAGGIANPKSAEAMLRKIPARRFGKPAELGPLVVLLASPGSDYLTGETIVIDGGQTAR